MLRKLFTNSLIYFFTLVGGKLLTAVFFIILARVLLPEKLGEVTYFLTIITLVTSIFDLGIKQFFQKKMATDAHAWLFTQITYLRLILYILSIIIILIISTIFPNFIPVCGWLSICLLVEALFSVADAHYLSTGKSLRLGQKLIARNIILFAYFLFTLFATNPFFLNLNFFYLFYTVTIFMVLIFYFPYSQLRFAQLDFTKAKIVHLIKKTWIYGVMDSSSVLYSKSDSMVIQNILGATPLGIYGAAYRFLDSFNLLPQALFHNLFRISAKKNAVSRAQLRTLVIAMGSIGLGIGLGLFIISEPLILILMGEAYAPAIPILRIFSLVIFLFFTNSPLNIMIQSSNLLKKYLPWTMGIVILNLILNLIFLSITGEIIVAAWIMVFCELLTICINVRFVKKIYK